MQVEIVSCNLDHVDLHLKKLGNSMKLKLWIYIIEFVKFNE